MSDGANTHRQSPSPSDSLPSLSSRYLKCPICFELMRGAAQTSCGHSFCSPCLTSHLKRKDECPSCRKRVVSAQPSLLLRQLVDDHRARKNKPLLPQDITDIIAADALLPNPHGQGRGGVGAITQHISNLLRSRNARVWLAVAVVFAYILLPFDLFPDALGAVGYVDDVVLLVVLFIFLIYIVRS